MSEGLTRKKLEARLLERADQDENFRQLLLQNAKQAIEMEFAEHVPQHVIIHVHEEQEGTYHFVIPWNPFAESIEEEELSDEELEVVAGGTYDCTDVVLATALCTMHKYG